MAGRVLGSGISKSETKPSLGQDPDHPPDWGHPRRQWQSDEGFSLAGHGGGRFKAAQLRAGVICITGDSRNIGHSGGTPPLGEAAAQCRGDHHRPVGLGDSTLDRPKVCEQQQGPKLLGATLTPVRIPGTAKKPESWATTELPKELSGLQIETLAGRPKEWYILEPLATEEAEGWGEATALTAAWAPRH